MTVRFDNPLSSFPPAVTPVPQIRQLPVEQVPAASAPVAPPAPPAAAVLQTGTFLLAGFDASQAQFRGNAAPVQLQASTVPDKVLDKGYLFRALTRALDHLPGQPSPLVLSAASPVIAGIRTGAPPEAGAVKQDPVDARTLAAFGPALANVAKLPEAERPAALAAAVLAKIDPQNKLPAATRQALTDFLSKLPADSLLSPEVQGAGGAATGHGVTGSGAEGQYVNSVLSSLQQLADTGRLSKEVLVNLTALTDDNQLQAQLKPQKQALIRSVLQEIAFPEKISQHSKATCAPTTCQIVFAVKDPAAYVKLVAGLASPAGKGTPDGAIVREPGTETDDKSGRSLSSRLIQPALMEFGNGEFDYDNVNDKHIGLGAMSIYSGFSGLGIEGTAAILNKLMPAQTYTQTYKPMHRDEPNGTEIFRQVKEQTGKGTPISAGLRWGNDSHEILVTKLDEQAKLAYFMNPWGELQSMPLEEFSKRLIMAAIPDPPASGDKAAMAALPAEASRPESYKPIDVLKYRSAGEHIANDPTLKGFFGADADSPLGKKLVTMKVPIFALDYLSGAIKNHGLKPAAAAGIAARLQACATPDETVKLLRLISFAQFAQSRGSIGEQTMQSILNAHPEKHLSTAKFEALIDTLNKGEREKAVALAGESLSTCLASLPAEQRGAMLSTLLTPVNASEDERKLAELQLGAKAEQALSPEELGKLAGVLVFGEGDASLGPDLLFKAYQAQLGGYSPEQATSLLRQCVQCGEAGLAGKLLAQLSKDPKMSGMVESLVQKLSNQELEGLPLPLAKNLRQQIGSAATPPSLARLDKAIKAGEELAKQFQSAETAEAAPAPRTGKAAPTGGNKAEPQDAASRATDKELQGWYTTALGEASKLKPAQRKEFLLKQVMAKVDPENKLDKTARAELLKFIQQLPLDAQLAAFEVQGPGGEDTSGVGVTGSGKDGHYVNGMLTSIQQLIKSGRMTADLARGLTALSDGNKMLPALKDQRDGLIRSVLQDIAFPESINQHSKGTCAPTTTQIILAVKDPTRYVQLVTGLASKEGKGTTGGKGPDDDIVREPGTEVDDKSGRSISGRLIQPALMEYGNGEDDYDNVHDKHVSKGGDDGDSGSGLGIDGVNRILNKLFGEGTHTSVYAPTPPERAKLYAQVSQQLNQGNPVSVGLEWSDSGHQLLVTKLDEEKKLAYLMNPWGELQTMPLEEFKKKLDAAALPTAANGNKPAIELLSELAKKPENYRPLDPEKYSTALDLMEKDPKLSAFFSDKQRKELGAKFLELQLPFNGLNYLSAALKAGTPMLKAEDFVKLLNGCKNKDEGQKMLRLIGFAGSDIKGKTLTPVQYLNVVKGFNGLSLTTSQTEKVLEALDKGKLTELRDLFAKRFGQALQNQSPAERAEFIPATVVLPAKDAESRPLVDLLLKASPHLSLSPAELGQLAAGIAMSDFSEPVGSVIVKVLAAAAANGNPEQAAGAVKSLLDAGESELAAKLLDQIRAQGKMPFNKLAESVCKGLDEGYLTGIPIKTLQDLHAVIKTSQDPSLRAQAAIFDKTIKERLAL